MANRYGLGLALALTISGLPAIQAQPAAAPAAPSCVDEAADTAAAVLMAQRCDRRVEDLSKRTETREVYAKADGTFTAVLHGGPARIKQGNRWVDVDLNLERKSDGSVGSKVHPHGLRLSGAAGVGTHELVSTGSGAARVGYGWTGVLPEPELDGTRATYRNVRPGVDLVIEATRSGFEQYLVVASPEAAAQLGSITLPLRTGGRRLEVTGRHMELRDTATDRVEVVSPEPEMWDASVEPGSGEHRRAPVGVQVRRLTPAAIAAQGRDAALGTDLVLTPDAEFLADPVRQFPVTIDPAVHMSEGASFDTWVQNSYQNTDNQSSTQLRLGHATDSLGSYVARSYLRFQMNDGSLSLAGAHIFSAKLSLWEFHSWSCTARKWYAQLTGPVGSGTRWNVEPGWDPSTQVESSETTGYSTSCNDGWVHIYPTPAVVAAAANGWPDVTIGLKGSNDSDVLTWKKFNSNNASSGTPVLEIDYNHYPSVPASVTVDGSVQCGSGEGVRQYLAVNNPVVTARLNDVNSGQNLTGELELKQGSTVVYSARPSDQPVAPGQVARWSGFPLTPGLVYTYRVRTNDSADVSGWTAPCELQAFPNPPLAPQVSVTSGDFTVHQITSVTFRPAAGDIGVVSYEYGWDPSRFSMFANARNDGSATVPITLQNEDGGILYVRAKNWAGKVSTTWTELDVSFPNSGPTQPPARNDFNGDGRADVIVTQDLGGGRTGVYMLAGLNWAMHDPVVLADTTAYPLASSKPLVGDFTGDGKADMSMSRAVTSTSATISVLASDGSGVADTRWWDSIGYGSYSVAATKLLAGRVNGDGADDLIALTRVSSCSWRVRVFLSTGVSFANPMDVGGVSGCFDLDKAKPLAVDHDGDGDTDVAFFTDLGGCQSKLYLLTNNGGTYGAEAQQWDSGANGMCWAQIQTTSADYTHDGRDDIFTAYDQGSCQLHEYEWDSTGASYTTRDDNGYWNAGGWCGNKLELQSGDYDGDTYQDFVYVYRCCGLYQTRVITNHGWGGGFDAYDEWQGALGRPGVGWITAGFDWYDYQLVNVNSGKCLSVPGAATGSGVQLIQETCNPTALNQRFDPEMWRWPQGRLLPAHTSGCVDVSGSSLADGAVVQQWACNGTDAQNFFVEYMFGLTETAVRFVNKNSNKCIDVPGSSTADGALIQQWTCNSTNAQNFYLRRVG